MTSACDSGFGMEETHSFDIFRGLSNSKGQRIYFETEGGNEDTRIVIRIVNEENETRYEIPWSDRMCLFSFHKIVDELTSHATKKSGNIARLEDLRG